MLKNPLEFTMNEGIDFEDLKVLQIRQGTNSEVVRELIQVSESLRIRKSKPIVFTTAILYWLSIPFVFLKTISVIQGKKGVHKSRLAELICAVFIALSINSKNKIGMEKNTDCSITVSLVDTERNLEEQLPYAIQQILINAGYKIVDDPVNFEYVSFINVERDKRFNTLRDYIKYLRTKHKNHIVVVIDVISDCLKNFNDPANSLELIDLMNQEINNHDVSFICVLHENPGTDKARGHLGTEIVNKSSTVLQIGELKDKNNDPTGVIKVNFLHTRTTKRPSPVYLTYSDEAKGLILADLDSIKTAVDSMNKSLTVKQVIELLEEYLDNEMSSQALISLIQNEYSCSDRTIRERLAEVIKEGILSKNGISQRLCKKKKGKEIFYYLQDIICDEV